MDIEVTNTSGVHEDDYDADGPGSTPCWDNHSSDSFDSQDSSYDIRHVSDKSFSSDKRSCCGKRGRAICAVCLIAITAASITVAILVPSRHRGKSNTVASGTAVETSDPTAAPTSFSLPPQCIPFYESVDGCLKNELNETDADFCIDCAWRFLPQDKDDCENLDSKVCNVLQSCGCGPCKDDLAIYLDCQTSCEIGDCSSR